MNSLIIYVLQVVLVFTALYLLYKWTLSRLTFHSLNRLILLLLLPISLITPLTDSIAPSISRPVIEVPILFEPATISGTDTSLNTFEKPIIQINNRYALLFVIVYWIGVILCLLRFFFSNRKLILLKHNAIVHHRNNFKLVVTNVSEIFSYFNWIFIPEKQLKEHDALIIEHEKGHINLNHSLDLIFAELYITFFWFNPMVYLYRKSLKSVHEFQADDFVLKKQVKTSYYMQLLLESLEIRKPKNLYHYFNHPIIKKRIDMMTKTKSRNISKFKYLVMVAVCALFLFAFTKPNIKNNTSTTTVDVVTLEKSLPPSLFPIQNGVKSNITSLFGVKRKHPKIDDKIVHGGIDIRAKIGTPVVATADGTIAKAAIEGNWGNLIVILHAGGYETWYAHLNGFNIKENQQVKKGDIIGYVGNTGLSTGPHLHYEVKLNGNRVNPIDYIED